MKARIKFRKYGALRFIGHLDVMRFFQKVMRRAEIPIAFTGGYSPHMIMSFASPLGIGLSSDGEYFDIELIEPVESEDAVRRMNEACVEGIEVVSIRQIAEEKKMTGMTILAGADYLVSIKEEALPDGWQDQFRIFMEQSEIRIVKQTKRSETEVDIRPMIWKWEIRGDKIYLQVASGSAQNLKPDLVMEAFVRFLEERGDYRGNGGTSPLETGAFGYHRLEMYADMGENGERKLLTLESLGKDMKKTE
ncbi:MAG TPA: TIGR03936 family radical SAM-associated protein [Candidatus Mediterraneibacter stercoripullorum]|nr:TIGR03936 family radical SAM-associated protein [Candidatus Mediterraneibacter stercoripullorum]